MNPNNLKLAHDLRHELHAHPELPCREVWTRQRLMDFLRAHTKLEVVDRGRWFYAAYHAGEDKPAIAFRADFDAVPVQETCDIPWKSRFDGISHKCGHDGHSATLAAFALEVDQKGADKNIYFLFQHAEENGEGARECCALIPEKGILEIFAYHNMPGVPRGTASMRVGTTNCASRCVAVFFTGHPSHAGHPEKGLNPALAMAELMLAIPGFIAPENWSDLVLVTIVNAQLGESATGAAPYGVSPGEGAVRFTCRAVHEEELNTVVSRLEALARKLGEKYGLAVDVVDEDTAFPETVAHAQSVEKVRAACAAAGVPVMEKAEPGRASEDFGHYTKLIPGVIFLMGAGDGPAVHTHEYDFDDSLIAPAVEIFKKLAGTPDAAE